MATACVEIPFWNVPGFVRQRRATALITTWLFTVCPTEDGFVCGSWIRTEPVGEYGWPR